MDPVTLALANGYTNKETADAAPLVSPAFGGTPTSPTAPAGDISNQIATTDFVHTSIMAVGGYSYDERVIGTWLDGKPLYEVTKDFSNVAFGTTGTSDSAQNPIAHGVSDVDMMIVHEAFYRDTGNTIFGNSFANVTGGFRTTADTTAGNNNSAMFIADDTTVKMYTHSRIAASTNRTWRLVLRYTKTTD